MPFRLDKCTQMKVLNYNRCCRCSEQYTYLGITQANGCNEVSNNQVSTKSKLDLKELAELFEVQDTNTYALPVITYQTGIITWAQQVMQYTGIKRRKHLAVQVSTHIQHPETVH